MQESVTRATDAIASGEESFAKRWWRPAAAFTYLVVCLFDFLVAPIFMPWWCVALGIPVIMWTPLTLQGAGLFHLSFGAILGVYAWSRGQEKKAIIAAARGSDAERSVD